LIVEPCEIALAGFRALLSGAANIVLIGDAASKADGLAQTRRLRPEVVITSVRLPDGSGIGLCREIAQTGNGPKLIVSAVSPEEGAILNAVSAGANGYLLQDTDADRFEYAICTVARGHFFLDSGATSAVFEYLRRTASSSSAQASRDRPLSSQEERVLALVSQGKTNREIATVLRLSYKTVKNYLSTILRKLNVKRRSEAAALFGARQAGTGE
jgi:two-component system response regulator DevR